MKNLLILFGGKSGEHEVSCISAKSVLENISKEKYNIIKVGITKDGNWHKTDCSAEDIGSGKWAEMPKTRAVLSPDPADHGLITADGIIKIDVIFPVMHGDYCEDGCVQGLFELCGIPYVGPGVLSSSVGMDKAATKLFADFEGLPQAEWLVLKPPYKDEMLKQISEKFSYPIFVKPCNAGSSLGASKVHNEKEFKAAFEEAARIDSKILCEEYINAREVECAVLGNEDAKASVLGEIIPSNEFYDYKAKYIDNKSGFAVPADLPEESTAKIRDYAVRIFKALGCRGLSRVDFFVDKESGRIYFNEINTLPGFTSISMYPKLMENAGLSYSEQEERLIRYAFERADVYYE